MLKLKRSYRKDQKFFWIVGCPRSGTTLLTKYIGQFVDACYNEPFLEYPQKNAGYWTFPRGLDTIVFKWCENWESYKVIIKRFPESYFIHVWRHPKQVLYSLFFPKKNSEPQRDFGFTRDLNKFGKALDFWHSYTDGCLSIQDSSERHLNVIYEHISIKELSNFTKIDLSEEISFSNRNDIEVLPKEMAVLEAQWRLKEHKNYYEKRKEIEDRFYKS